MTNKKRGKMPVATRAQDEYFVATAPVMAQNDLIAPDSADRLGSYAAGLEKIMNLEAKRNELNHNNAASSDLSAQGLNSSNAGNGLPSPLSSQESIRIAEEYKKRLLSLQTYNSQVLQNNSETGAQQAQMERNYADHSIKLEADKRDFQINAASQTASMTANFMQNLYVATGSKNQALFEMMKAFAIARAMISGTEAVVSAYAWGTFFGGPPLGAAFAAVAATATAAQIAQIASLSPGGAHSSISAGGTANPAYHGGSTTAYPVPQRLEDKAKQNVTIQIYNPLSDQNWQRIVEDNIVPALNSAADRNIALKMSVMG